jgi:hypothetical protein
VALSVRCEGVGVGRCAPVSKLAVPRLLQQLASVYVCTPVVDSAMS